MKKEDDMVRFAQDNPKCSAIISRTDTPSTQYKMVIKDSAMPKVLLDIIYKHGKQIIKDGKICLGCAFEHEGKFYDILVIKTIR